MMWDYADTAYLVCVVFCLPSAPCVPQGVLARDANDNCKHGLAAFNDVLKGEANTEFLREGDSGWINGFADLSGVLSFDGCFELEDGDIKIVYTDKSMSIKPNCIGICKGSSYIGLSAGVCYCIKGEERNVLNSKKVKCDDKCLLTTTLSCDAHTLVYRLAGEVIKPEGHQQCVYIYKTNGRIRYGSASCHTVSGKSIHGYICIYDGVCNKKPKTYGGCIEETFNDAWTQAYTKCERNNGSLISTAYIGTFTNLALESNKNYWIGEFRAIVQTNEKTDACLAVTKVHDSFQLDSYDCNTSKQPICHLPGKNANTQSYPFSTTAAPLIPETPPTEASDVKSGQVSIIIGVTIGGLALLVVIACSLLTWKRSKRNDTAVNRNTLLTHENDFTNTGTDKALTNEETKDVSEADHHYEAPIVDIKAAPDKPERHTLRRQKQSLQSYENFQLIPIKDTENETAALGSVHVHANLANDEYDRIDLKHVKQHGKPKSDYVDSEMNIYNHTGDSNNDDAYDTTHPRPSATISTENYTLVHTHTLPQDSCNNISKKPKQDHVHGIVDKRSAMDNDKYHVTEMSAVNDSVYSVAQDSGQNEIRPMCGHDNQTAIYSVAQKAGYNKRGVNDEPSKHTNTYSVAQNSRHDNRNVMRAPDNPLDIYSVAHKSGHDKRNVNEAPGTPIDMYSVAHKSGYNKQGVSAKADIQNKPRDDDLSEAQLEALKCGLDEAESAYHYVDDDQLSHDGAKGLPIHDYTDDNYAVIGQPDHASQGTPNKDQSKCPTEAVYEEVNNLK